MHISTFHLLLPPSPFFFVSSPVGRRYCTAFYSPPGRCHTHTHMKNVRPPPPHLPSSSFTIFPSNRESGLVTVTPPPPPPPPPGHKGRDWGGVWVGVRELFGLGGGWVWGEGREHGLQGPFLHMRQCELLYPIKEPYRTQRGHCELQ